MSKDKRFRGPLTRVGGCLPAVEIDCSQWPRDRSAPRSTGKLGRGGQASPASASPAPNVKQESPQPKPAWLELVVTFAADVPPTEVWLQVNLLLQAMTTAAPELKLTYDAFHSRAENGDVVIALTPADAAGAAERIGALTDALRSGRGNGIQVLSIRLAA